MPLPLPVSLQPGIPPFLPVRTGPPDSFQIRLVLIIHRLQSNQIHFQSIPVQYHSNCFWMPDVRKMLLV